MGTFQKKAVAFEVKQLERYALYDALESHKLLRLSKIFMMFKIENGAPGTGLKYVSNSEFLHPVNKSMTMDAR